MAPKQQPGPGEGRRDLSSRGDVDPSATDLVVDVLVAGQLMMNRLEALLRPHGLSSSTFTLLQIVAGDPEPVTPSQIAGRAMVPVTTATVTGLIDTCERRGWVQRRRHATDRRMVVVDITAAGREVLVRADSEVAIAEERWAAGTSPAVRRRMSKALRELADHLRSTAADPD